MMDEQPRPQTDVLMAKEEDLRTVLCKKAGFRTFREGYPENQKCLGSSLQSTSIWGDKQDCDKYKKRGENTGR